MFTRFIKEVFREAPLNDFGDYDTYWTQRESRGYGSGPDNRSVAVEPMIRQGESVLDIGCGAGSFLAMLKERRSDCAVFGLDISAKSIEICRRRGLECAVLDPARPVAEQVPGEFDVVTLMEVIEHVADAEELFKQASTLARRRVIVTIPNAGFFLNRLRLLLGRWPITVIEFHMKEHLRFWTVKDFCQWARYMGMNVVAMTAQNPNWLRRLWPSMFARQVVYVLEKAHS